MSRALGYTSKDAAKANVTTDSNQSNSNVVVTNRLYARTLNGVNVDELIDDILARAEEEKADPDNFDVVVPSALAPYAGIVLEPGDSVQDAITSANTHFAEFAVLQVILLKPGTYPDTTLTFSDGVAALVALEPNTALINNLSTVTFSSNVNMSFFGVVLTGTNLVVESTVDIVLNMYAAALLSTTGAAPLITHVSGLMSIRASAGSQIGASTTSGSAITVTSGPLTLVVDTGSTLSGVCTFGGNSIRDIQIRGANVVASGGPAITLAGAITPSTLLVEDSTMQGDVVINSPNSARLLDVHFTATSGANFVSGTALAGTVTTGGITSQGGTGVGGLTLTELSRIPA